jgi:hypothetical protein
MQSPWKYAVTKIRGAGKTAPAAAHGVWLL